MSGETNSNSLCATDKIKTVRAYYKLCVKQEHRSIVLKDAFFFATLPALLKDDNFDIVRYTVKILVLLTEQSDDIKLLLKSPDLLSSLSEACEKITSPSVNYNLVLISSRIRSVKASIEARAEKDASEPLSCGVRNMDKSEAIHRKFVGRKSKQITMEFDPDEFDVTKQREIERALLKMKGVISVYMTELNNVPKAVLRTIPSVDVRQVSQIIFAAGFEYVAQVVKIDGKEEKYEFYASEIQKNGNVELPDYLDDDMLNVDTTKCVITNDMANRPNINGSGWFSSLTSLVKTSLW
uniref:Armadillo repeat-containing protein 1 n=1 Tax=Caenorhabditis japonica TaxID=281687 RepID=A0A8R1DH78_CAEJA